MTTCYQRKLRMMYNTPLSRLTPISPYQGTITKEDLDMRRKAEILKYHSHVGKRTKAQNYSQTVRGHNPSQKTSTAKKTSTISETSDIEDNCDSMHTLSTNSDVPGPPIFLYLDKGIPLYNYSGEERTYSMLPPVIENILHFYSAGLSFPASSTIKIGTLSVVKTTSPLLQFTLDIPYTFPKTVVGAKLYITCDGNIATDKNPISLSSFMEGSRSSLTCISSLYSMEGMFYEFFLIATTTDALTIDFENVSFTSS